MSGFFDDSATNKSLLAILSNRTIRDCFNHKLSVPYTEPVASFIKWGTAFYEGRFIDDKFPLTWLKANHITNDLFKKFYHNDSAFSLIEQSLLLYVKLHDKKGDIGLFMYNPNYFHSDLLRYASRILHDKNIVELEKVLKPRHKELMTKAEEVHSGNAILAVLSLYEWYMVHSKRLSELNRGTFSISPLNSVSAWLSCVLEWMVKYGVFYANSVPFYKFTENFAELYHISWDGEIHTGLGRVDTNYEHKNGYSSPLSLLDEIKSEKMVVGVDIGLGSDYSGISSKGEPSWQKPSKHITK